VQNTNYTQLVSHKSPYKVTALGVKQTCVLMRVSIIRMRQSLSYCLLSLFEQVQEDYVVTLAADDLEYVDSFHIRFLSSIIHPFLDFYSI
jgi:hypothetical protein